MATAPAVPEPIETPERPLSAEELQALQQAELEHELARLKRLGIFTTFVAAVMLSFLFLSIVYTILLLLAGFVYLFSPCLMGLALSFLSSPSNNADNNNKTMESGSILEQATDINHDTQVSFGFDQARSEIRSCESLRFGSKEPPEGVYQVVYAADYFGRALRTEGELWVKWTPVSNGWEMQGQSRSASGPPCILRDGFLNSDGEMYWLGDGKTSGKPILYRGNFDLNTFEMFDGEFLSKDNSLKGRIVRMSCSKEMEVPLLDDTQSIVQEDWGSTDIEMVAQEIVGKPPEFD
eukprot:scaffold162_cov176-Amphora_coffeaeformis.AAC.8